jgi:hypothetical protein
LRESAGAGWSIGFQDVASSLAFPGAIPKCASADSCPDALFAQVLFRRLVVLCVLCFLSCGAEFWLCLVLLWVFSSLFLVFSVVWFGFS